ncbi:polyamine acetyltransferase [Whalleya microplaca]|nr:polyamine acetyltransferase [Whalleya microplaca]
MSAVPPLPLSPPSPKQSIETTQEREQEQTADPSNAIDDTEDLPDDFVDVQKTISEGRRGRQQSPASTRRRTRIGVIAEILPFPFAPNIGPLTVSDVASCDVLEAAAFTNPRHRASREKFEYRLSACPELSLGLFCTVVPANAGGFEIDTLATARRVETARDDGAVGVLMAHIVGTRSDGERVTDLAMDYPRDWRTTKRRNTSGDGPGHRETGRTVCLHTLAVHPKLQGCGLGKLIMKSYLQLIKNSGMADRVSLICQEYLVNYYVRFGFRHLGPSEAAFGGGNWHDMTFEFEPRAL